MKINFNNPALAHWGETMMGAARDRPTSIICGVRRIIENYHWSWPVDLLRELPITFPDLAYKSFESKMRQLDRNYLNQESWDTAMARFAARGNKPTSIGVSTHAAAKESRSQGFCMVGAALYRAKKSGPMTLNIFYRSTELFQKHTADLLWLRERTPKEVHTINFHAGSAYLSAMFMPIYCRFIDNPHELILACDNKEWAKGMRPFLNVDTRHTYKPTLKMRAYFLQHVAPEKVKLLNKHTPILKRQEELDMEDDD